MPRNPQRPYVPRQTPAMPRPAIAAPEFRLYRPFLPGSETGALEPVAFIDSGRVMKGEADVAVSLRSIDDFLDTTPAVRDYPQSTAQDFFENEGEDEPNDLPPVEHFLDPLPPVDAFAPEGDAWPKPGDQLASTGVRAPDPSETGWVETDWQHFDWRAAAALGETAVKEASTAWAATDWDGTTQPPREPRPSAANAIATALDEIARRIREGELSPSGPGPVTDPATIAATLAALLGVRR